MRAAKRHRRDRRAGPGATTCLSSGYGAASNTRRWYLRAYDSVSEARASLGRYLDFYKRASQHPSVYVIEEKRLC